MTDHIPTEQQIENMQTIESLIAVREDLSVQLDIALADERAARDRGERVKAIELGELSDALISRIRAASRTIGSIVGAERVVSEPLNDYERRAR